MALARRVRGLLWAGLISWAGLATGCAHKGEVVRVAPVHDLPRELDKVTLPTYRVEPPDILLIEAIKAVPKPPYKLEPLDVLYVAFPGSPFKDDPLNGLFTIEPDGTINLGPTYGGAVRVEGMSIPEAQAAIEKVVDAKFKDAKVTVSLAQSRAGQRVTGPHLVRPDGTIGLGVYGAVKVAGLSIAEARAAVEEHLSREFLRPQVSVDVAAFNSKLYYVILDGAGAGQQVVRLPHTGNETVLDAIALVNGLLPVSDKREIVLARPSRMDQAGDQVYPVDWESLTTRGSVLTNYQLLPGDRVYVHSDHLVEFDTRLARLLSPIERVLGVSLLGYTTVRTVAGKSVNSGGTGVGF
jgi:polysaccharide biosynthesis/export protein